MQTPWPGGVDTPDELVTEYFRNLAAGDRTRLRSITDPGRDPATWANPRKAPVRLHTFGCEPDTTDTAICVVTGSDGKGAFRTGLTLIRNAGKWYVMHEWNPRRQRGGHLPTSMSTVTGDQVGTGG